jgi:Uncharacterized conserved protein
MVANIGVANVDTAVEFYRSLLGFDIVRKFSDHEGIDWAHLKYQNIELTFFRKSDREKTIEASNVLTLFMNCDNVEALYNHFILHGYQPEDMYLTFYHSLEFKIKDPEGYMLFFSQNCKEINMTKKLLLEKIKAKYNELQEVIRSLPLVMIQKPGVQGEWSIKDIIAHLTAWNKRLICWIQLSNQGEIPQTPEPGYTWDKIHQLNHDTFMKFKDVEFNKILDDFEESYFQVLTYINTYQDDDLNNCELYSWTNGQPLWVDIGFNTFDHYRSHLVAIKKWVGIEKDLNINPK